MAHLEEVRQTSENVGQVINSLQDVFRLLSIMGHLGGIVVNKVRHVKARPGFVREKLESSAKPRAQNQEHGRISDIIGNVGVRKPLRKIGSMLLRYVLL